ncbi:MAG: HAD family phosphatase [Chloroflexi bacterium]|nr:HAD family phosphatase [Chloroflexota bacterium]
MNTNSKSIQLVVLDIDGVLTDGESRPLDLEMLQLLAGMNEAAQKDANLPAVTLCSGRPAAYVEALLQAIAGHLPGIYENGAGLFVPHPYGFHPHPQLADEDGFREVRDRLESDLVKKGVAFIQPGKVHSLTLFAHDPSKTSLLRKQAEDALGTLVEKVDLTYSTSCLNVLPRGMDKGKGIEFLAKTIDLGMGNMLGVGDSDVDLPFLAIIGHRAAPENANAQIKKLVDYVSPKTTSKGLHNILQHYGLLV